MALLDQGARGAGDRDGEAMMCHESDSPDTPCRYAGKCDEAAQRFMHMRNLRGEDCWRFQKWRSEAAYQPDDERSAIQSEGA